MDIRLVMWIGVGSIEYVLYVESRLKVFIVWIGFVGFLKS